LDTSADERDLPAFLGEFDGGGLADTTPGSRDNCGFDHEWAA
jgi:hypothetical protein